jgi:hypothetical protein
VVVAMAVMSGIHALAVVRAPDSRDMGEDGGGDEGHSNCGAGDADEGWVAEVGAAGTSASEAEWVAVVTVSRALTD